MTRVSLSKKLLLSIALMSMAILSSHGQLALKAPAADRKIVGQVDVNFKGAATMDPNRIRAQMSTRVGEP